MKALTLWQPWASLVPLGFKPVETRSWSTDHRGPLAVHAGKKCEPGELGEFYVEQDNPRGSGPAFLLRGPIVPPYRLPLGAVVATCNLVACVPIRKADDWPDDKGQFIAVDEEADCVRLWTYSVIEQHVGNIGMWSSSMGLMSPAYGDFSPGRFAFLLDDIERLPAPVPARGRQGLWDWAP